MLCTQTLSWNNCFFFFFKALHYSWLSVELNWILYAEGSWQNKILLPAVCHFRICNDPAAKYRKTKQNTMRIHHKERKNGKRKIEIISILSSLVISCLNLRQFIQGRKICWHYERNGDCKYGSTCSFDHPVNYSSSTISVGSTLDPPSIDNSAPWID